MKLSLKLPLAFGVILLLMSSAALYGIYSLNRSLDTYANTVLASHANAQAASDVLILFKTQNLEWKDSLLRGDAPKKLEKHWGAFSKTERDVSERSKTLAAALPEGEARALVQKFIAAHTAMGLNYRKGFEEFKSANFDPLVGDTLVQGMDREPVRLLGEATRLIEALNATVVHFTWSFVKGIVIRKILALLKSRSVCSRRASTIARWMGRMPPRFCAS